VKKKVALVAGASGIVGRGLVEHLTSLGEWRVIGLARKAPDGESRARHIAVDLLDPQGCKDRLGGLGEVTHVFYAAYQERPTEAEQVAANGAMLRNLVNAIEAAAPGLEHVSLTEGVKAYGCQFGPFKTPAKETDPRHMPPNFYYDQEDFLRERQRGRAWTWSVLRPNLVCGPGVGHPMNLTMVIAVYASMSRELGLPLWFPGTRGAYTSLFEATDAVHLARAAVWAGTEPRCANQVFIYERRSVPLGAPLAPDRRLLRLGARAPPADPAHRNDGRQRAALGRDGQEARAAAPPLRGDRLLAFRRVRLPHRL
jgi:nucleoside-diphosphate-sugar epimerase